MNPLHTAPQFSWPDVLPAEEKHTATWSESADYLEPSQTHDLFLGGLDIDAGALFGNLHDSLENVGTASTEALTSDQAPSNIYLEDLTDNCNDLNPDFLGPWLMSTPPLTDSSSISSPFGDAPWAEDTLSPTCPTTPMYNGPIPTSSATQAAAQAKLTWLFEPGQFGYTTPSCLASDKSLGVPIAPDYAANFLDNTNPFGASLHPAEWVSAESLVPIHDAATNAVPVPATSSTAQMPAVLGTILGKRPRGAEDTYDNGGLGTINDYQPRPRKKGKGKMAVNGVLEAAGSSSRARHKPATRTLAQYNGKSETAGCGAGMLAATNAQEVYHQYMPGPSVQQVLVGTTAPGQLTRVEGSGVTWHHNSSVVQPEVEIHSTEADEHEEQAEDELFRIPRRMKERHCALLAATPADWKRGTVAILKCCLCPGADFSDWENFKRHCDTAEAHPLNITFCSRCGDFFARPDALVRHGDKRPYECIGVSADVAAFKRQETNRVLEEYKAIQGRCMKTGEKLGMPFSNIIKAMFPESSKKGSKEQSRLSVVRRSKYRKARCQ